MTSIVSMMTESDITSPTSTTPSSSDLNGSRKLDDKMAYRKSNKPMMEKKRRARINSCLTQLKSLVLQAMKKDNSQYSKLEKADILELTVKHLKNVQRLHNGLAMPQVPDAINKYRAGFNECANEVMRYLGETQDVNSDARTRILSHLATILTPINSLPLQQSHTPILPAPPMSTATPSSSSASSQLQLHQQQQLQQQQQSSIMQHALQNQQQNQQLHQHQHALLTQEAIALGHERLGVGDNANMNVQSTIGQTCHMTGTGNAPQTELNHVITTSPTAFQTPVVNSVSKSSSSSLQLSCIAATPAAMATGTPLHFVPSALPTGQVAFVLTPQSIPAMSVYTPSVIAASSASSTVSPEFAMSVMDQQQLQFKQDEQRQLSLSDKRPAPIDAPIALVTTKQSKLTKTDPHTSSPMLERSNSSASSISSTPSTASLSSTPLPYLGPPHSGPPPSSSVKTVPQPKLSSMSPYTSSYSYRDDAVLLSKSETRGCITTVSRRDNIENFQRGQNSESIRDSHDIDKLRNYKRESSEDHRPENSRREVPTDILSRRDCFQKPDEAFRRENVDFAKRRGTMKVQEKEMDMSTRRITNDFDGVIDYRMTKLCSAEVKVNSTPPTWRPW